MNSILDAALGVAIVFAVFALVVSGINEVIASRLNLRGKQLFDALDKLMGDKAIKLLNDPFLAPLNRVKKSKPTSNESTSNESPSSNDATTGSTTTQGSGPTTTTLDETPPAPSHAVDSSLATTKANTGAYLPSWMFAAALLRTEVREQLETLSAELPSPAPGDAAAGVKAAADAAIATAQKAKQDAPTVLATEVGGPLADILQRLWADASGDFTKLETSLANWFDGYMDRVSGWYKRNTRVILLLIALVVAVVGNVDAVSITREVINDAPLRAVLSQDASTIKACPTGSSSLACAQQDLKSIPGTQLGLFWSSSCPKVQTVVQSGGTQTTVVTTNGVAGAAVTKQQTGPAKVTQTCLDNGWWAQHGFDSPIDVILRILGLLIGAFAISLGAPFWFDLIGRGVSLKGSGPAPAPASTTSS